MNADAFILVGGRSSRLGRDKALERVGGKTLAERALDAVRGSRVADKIYFAGRDDPGFAIEARRLDALFVFDLVEGRGPLGGLYTALTNASTAWVFVLACDLPFVTPQTIRTLSRFVSDENGVVVPEQPDGRLQPLCGFYKVAVAKPVVEEIVGRPRVPPAMHSVVAMLKPRVVKPEEFAPSDAWTAAYFANVNTMAELEDAREIERKLSGGGEI
jgi:molybdopterin-guanine dinucleotide biosynthesis protein A